MDSIAKENLAIDVENFRGYLRTYQQCVIWANMAALLLLLYTVDAQTGATSVKQGVDVGGSRIPLGVAWNLALVAFVTLFYYARSNLQQALALYQRLGLEALRRVPGFATHPSRLVRLGSIVLPGAVVLGSFVYELYALGVELLKSAPGALLVLVLVFAAPAIIFRLLAQPLPAPETLNDK